MEQIRITNINCPNVPADPYTADKVLIKPDYTASEVEKYANLSIKHRKIQLKE